MFRSLFATALVLVSVGNLCAEEDILTTAAQNGSFTTLTNLVVAADLDEALQSESHFTVFAPTDKAFSALPEETIQQLTDPKNKSQLADILKYHVLDSAITIADQPPKNPLRKARTLQGQAIRFERVGSQLMVNESLVITKNIKCSNGIIHVIDKVLTPPPKQPSLLDLATGNDDFSTLVAAVKAAGLTELLVGDKALTILAPTNEAFSKLPSSTLEELLKPENKDQLIAILSYHVIEGKVTAKQVVGVEDAKTLSGGSVKFTIQDGQLKVNESNVIKNDLSASNGIVHVIDTVLLPAKEDSVAESGSPSDRAIEKVVRISAGWDKSVRKDGIVANRLEIECGAGANIKLTNLRVNEIVTTIAGGGRVELTGNAKTHNARVSGGAELNAAYLGTESTSINVAGGADASVNALANLKVSAAAGATVRYVETGATIEKSITRYTEFLPFNAKTHDGEE